MAGLRIMTWFFVFVIGEVMKINALSVFYIEMLESNDALERTLMEDSIQIVNKKLLANTTMIKLSLQNNTQRPNDDISSLASSLFQSENIIAMFDFNSHPYNTCTLSTVTKIPLLRIHGSENYRMKDACDQVISMSADYTNYAHATAQILETFKWKKIAFMFERSRFYEIVYFKNLTTAKDYTFHFIQVDIHSNNNKDEIALKAARELAKTDADVILLYVDQGTFLLNTGVCYQSKVQVWIIQDWVPKNITANENHMVVTLSIPSSTRNVPWGENTSHHLFDDETSNLVYEAIDLVAMALVNAKRNGSWLLGNDIVTLNSNRHALYSYITKGSEGVTFDKSGNRLVEKLIIRNLVNDSLVEIGSWTKATNSVKFNKSISVNKEAQTVTKGLQGKKLTVVVVPNPPYVIRPRAGDDHYHGLCGDLIERIAADEKFTYEIFEQPDRKYGTEYNGTWDGMIGSLIDRKADMIVGDLTRTTLREQIVGMTVGYMFYTDKIIISKRSEIEVNDFLQFMSPMSVEVWVMAIVTLVVVTISMYVINYFSPYGMKNNQGTKTSEEFSLINCLWFSFCCTLQQGPDHSPKSVSGRVLAGFFWFTIMVWVATYTANLVAFFTVKTVIFPVRNLQTAIDSKYKFGVVEHSLIHKLFHYTKYELYERALARMTDLPKNDSQALEWVRKGDYLHLSEGPFADFITHQQPCDLKAVSGLETPRAFVFALRLNDPHVEDISLAILRLRENGYVTYLMDKYVKGTSQCPEAQVSQISSTESIQLHSIVGVFMVLGAGCVVSFLALCLEIFWHHKQSNKVDGFTQRKTSSDSTT